MVMIKGVKKKVFNSHMRFSEKQYRDVCAKIDSGKTSNITPVKKYILNINPIAKPRMVRSDKWKKRKAVTRYWKYSDTLNRLAFENHMPPLPVRIRSLFFFLPIPTSWTKVKKQKYINLEHTVRPDLDNLVKAFQDCLCQDDSHIAVISHGLGKFWSEKPRIEIEF